ncbi:RHS repeat-associated core domain-containing protein [Burkholderia cenocepacia]|uniref:RHS repeat-associated core domain-containing protein n=1 Tax=Burkholderia cenocepacia TaxID=95486 RepID=UPI000981FDD0|nr:RHS repeat-associated core domain-containing protein [Burkholderia cenocepacia]MBR8080999.1 RHS domain-containing protein [Burkholderia cenocepacia]
MADQKLPPGAEYEQATPWLTDVHPDDVVASGEGFNAWLISVTHGYVDVDRLKTVASMIPVLNNLMALADALTDIVSIIRKRGGELLDYLGLAINLIGVIPFPPVLAPMRLTARPLLALIRNEILIHKRDIGAALISVVITHVQASCATEIEDFLTKLQAVLNDVIDHCAAKAREILSSLADGIDAVLAGQLFDPAENERRAAEYRQQMKKSGWFSTDLVAGAWGYLAESRTALVKRGANAVTGTATGLVPEEYVAPIRQIAVSLRTLAPVVVDKINELKGSDEGKLMWLLLKLINALRHKRETMRAASIKSQGTTEATARRPQVPVAATKKEARAKGSGVDHCEECGVGASGGSISYAFGDETFSHADFELPGAMPVVWIRVYRSRLAGYDAGELGARWLSPYMTRIDVRDDKWIYSDSTGRNIEYPALAAGAVHDDRVEGVTLSRLDDTWTTVAYGHDLLHVYEKRGDSFRLALQKDRAGNTIALDYDDANRLARLVSSAGHTLAFHHDSRGRIATIEQIVDANTRTTLAQYQYDDNGDLVRAADRYGNVRQYVYDRHLIKRYTDRTGRGMNLEWEGAERDDNTHARCVREYADDGSHDIRLMWHPNIRLTYVTDALGNVTRYYYNIRGYMYRIAYPDGTEEWMRRDQDNNLVMHVHRDGGIEEMDYDARGNMTKHYRVDGAVIEMGYDDRDQLVRLKDPEGYVWERSYDDAGNLVVQKDPLGHETKYAYNAAGMPVKMVDAKGGAKVLVYDDAGQLLQYTDCSGKVTKWRYDGDGRLAQSIDAAGNATVYRYGRNGAVSEISSPAGTYRYTHDAEGRLLSHTDPMERVTRFSYDFAGRVASRVDALGYTLAYRYDRLGRLTALIDANRATYQFHYDPAGRLLEEIGFDGKRTTYGYSEGTLQPVKIDEGGQATELEFDQAGRIVCRTSGASTERFAYDASGRLVEALNSHSRTQMFFDPVGNLVREHHAYRLFGESRSYLWHHEYDEIGTRIKTVRPDGHVLDWLIYGSGHVHGLVLDGEERIQFERDDLHRETGRMLSSKVGQQTQYDPAGRITRQAIRRSNAPAALAERRYRYDAVGQLEHIEDSRKGVINYRYDPVGRLIAAIGPLGTETFAFDPASNIIDPGSPRHARTPGAVKASPVVPDSVDSTLPAEVPRVLGNLLKEYAGTHFEYDARGNLIGKRSPSGRQEYEWDGFNRLRVARVEETGRWHEARYFYDSFGRRIGKDVDGVRTVFGWDGDQLAYESNEGGATQYVYEPETFVPLAQYVTAQPVAGIQMPVWQEGEPYVPEKDPLQRMPERQSDAHLFYYHCDQIGTPLLMTDEMGEVVWEASYRAWGEAREVIARLSKAAGVEPRNPIRFQGQQEDAETGLRYNRYRYYDPTSGRFVSKDPIGLLGGVNSYQYATNPIAWIDPLGLACRRPGGYRVNDADQHGNLSPNANRAPGNTNTVADGLVQSHHPIQQEWAKQQVFPNGTYSSRAAPAVLLPSTSGSIHAQISGMQRAFRNQNGFNTDVQTEFNEAARQMRAAGVPESVVRRAIRQNYKYFDCLGAFNAK